MSLLRDFHLCTVNITTGTMSARRMTTPTNDTAAEIVRVKTGGSVAFNRVEVGISGMVLVGNIDEAGPTEDNDTTEDRNQIKPD